VPLQSMTGFARAEGTAQDGRLSWVWEARSVNGKGLDVRLRLPSGTEGLESQARKAAASKLSRGNVTLALHLSLSKDVESYKINEPLLDQLIGVASRKADEHPGQFRDIDIAGLLTVKGVVESADIGAADDTERAERDSELIAGLEQAVQRLIEARGSEGARLATLLNGQLDQIAKTVEEAGQLAALQPDALKARLKTQVEDLLESSSQFSQDRLTQEAAVLATKADVREEIDRLNAHVAQGRDLLAKGEPCGRKLEFLSQEFNREANTLCSKSTDVDLIRLGLELKAVIDQFREQIQNVE